MSPIELLVVNADLQDLGTKLWEQAEETKKLLQEQENARRMYMDLLHCPDQNYYEDNND